MNRPAGSLLAISDLHVAYQENREFVARLRPGSDGDWLLVAGDVGEKVADVEWALRQLRDRYATVVWAPGNHELWTPKDDPVTLRGEERYRHLVELCRGLGVVTPEDPYPVWTGAGGPVAVVPPFLLYDYSFPAAGPPRPAGSTRGGGSGGCGPAPRAGGGWGAPSRRDRARCCRHDRGAGVIEEILPSFVAVGEAFADPPDIELLGPERAAVGTAVPKRQREFATGRACARQALAQLGLPPAPLERGPRGEPQWPARGGGSITHCPRHPA